MMLEPTKVFVRFFILCLQLLLITLYISGEWKVLKTEVVPSQNLPEKSTFKIKISKKDNSKEVKVEEVKVKEEKDKDRVCFFKIEHPSTLESFSHRSLTVAKLKSPPLNGGRRFR